MTLLTTIPKILWRAGRGFNLVSRRWRLSLDRNIGLHLSEEQMDIQDTLHADSGKYRPFGDYFTLTLSKNWEFLKEDHSWYDGPHCAYSLGFIRFYMSHGSCEKCLK